MIMIVEYPCDGTTSWIFIIIIIITFIKALWCRLDVRVWQLLFLSYKSFLWCRSDAWLWHTWYYLLIVTFIYALFVVSLQTRNCGMLVLFHWQVPLCGVSKTLEYGLCYLSFCGVASDARSTNLLINYPPCCLYSIGGNKSRHDRVIKLIIHASHLR